MADCILNEVKDVGARNVIHQLSLHDRFVYDALEL